MEQDFCSYIEGSCSSNCLHAKKGLCGISTNEFAYLLAKREIAFGKIFEVEPLFCFCHSIKFNNFPIWFLAYANAEINFMCSWIRFKNHLHAINGVGGEFCECGKFGDHCISRSIFCLPLLPV